MFIQHSIRRTIVTGGETSKNGAKFMHERLLDAGHQHPSTNQPISVVSRCRTTIRFRLLSVFSSKLPLRAREFDTILSGVHAHTRG